MKKLFRGLFGLLILIFILVFGVIAVCAVDTDLSRKMGHFLYHGNPNAYTSADEETGDGPDLFDGTKQFLGIGQPEGVEDGETTAPGKEIDGADTDMPQKGPDVDALQNITDPDDLSDDSNADLDSNGTSDEQAAPTTPSGAKSKVDYKANPTVRKGSSGTSSGESETAEEAPDPDSEEGADEGDMPIEESEEGQ